MAIVLLSQGKDLSPWVKKINELRPDLDLRIYPECGNLEDIEFALAWKYPFGIFKEFPNLKCIASMGAGVDHILQDPDLPESATITRVNDDNLTSDMAEFVIALVMTHMRGLSFYKAAESKHDWSPQPYLRIRDVTIGVMGVGVLGMYVARQLNKLGFDVNGWARSFKDMEGVNVYAGYEALDDFLSKSDVLVCLLPLTPETENILNKEILSKLPENAYVINVARGKHVVDEDLIELIDNGHLSGASLDVFREEPLPQDHPFWNHPKIQITPHVASVTDPESVVPQLLENYDRLKNNEPLQNTVSRAKGY